MWLLGSRGAGQPRVLRRSGRERRLTRLHRATATLPASRLQTFCVASCLQQASFIMCWPFTRASNRG